MASLASIAAGMLLLLWPALLNGYPLVFADTGTYLSQAPARYVGWDRPPFYSLFILPLHGCVTVWPVILAQAALTLWVLGRIARRFGLGTGMPPLAIVTVLAVTTSLPWIAAMIMPDVLTGLLILLIADLFLLDARHWRQALVVSVVMVALVVTHLSHLLLLGAVGVGLALIARPPRANRVHLGLILAASAALLIATNAVAHRKFSLAPYGNTFLLARWIEDGPAMRVLARDCGRERWRLCDVLDALPMPADRFLWQPDGPLWRAGGPKPLIGEIDAIVRRTMAEEPDAVLTSALWNSMAQFRMAATGDGIEPWPATVGPWIARLFPPAERARYQAALQTRGAFAVPPLLRLIHTAAALLAGIYLVFRLGFSRDATIRAFAAAALLALPLNAAISGALSGPHDRYQSRVLWPLLAVAAMDALRFLRRRETAHARFA